MTEFVLCPFARRRIEACRIALRRYIAAAGFDIETAGDLDAAVGAGSPHSVDEPFPICMTMDATGW